MEIVLSVAIDDGCSQQPLSPKMELTPCSTAQPGCVLISPTRVGSLPTIPLFPDYATYVPLSSDDTDANIDHDSDYRQIEW